MLFFFPLLPELLVKIIIHFHQEAAETYMETPLINAYISDENWTHICSKVAGKSSAMIFVQATLPVPSWKKLHWPLQAGAWSAPFFYRSGGQNVPSDTWSHNNTLNICVPLTPENGQRGLANSGRKKQFADP